MVGKEYRDLMDTSRILTHTHGIGIMISIDVACGSHHGCHAGPQAHMDGEEYRDLMDVENLLESYFMLIDSTNQKLVSIGKVAMLLHHRMPAQMPAISMSAPACTLTGRLL